MEALRSVPHSSGPPDSGGRGRGLMLEAWAWLSVTRVAGLLLVLVVLAPLASLLVSVNWTDFVAGLTHPHVGDTRMVAACAHEA